MESMVKTKETFKLFDCSMKKQLSSPLLPLSNPQEQVRVLIVEDDPTWANLLARELKQDNFIPIWAPNFEMARQLLENSPFNLVILDINLGDNTHLGRVLIQLLKEFDLQIPVIIVSAILEPNGPEIVELTKEPLVFRIIFKQSFVLKKFQEFVREALQGKRSHGRIELKVDYARRKKDTTQQADQGRPQVLRLATGAFLAIFVFTITIGVLTRVSQQVPGYMMFWIGALGVSFDLIISTFILVVGGVISKRQAMVLFGKLLEKEPAKPFRNYS